MPWYPEYQLPVIQTGKAVFGSISKILFYSIDQMLGDSIREVLNPLTGGVMNWVNDVYVFDGPLWMGNFNDGQARLTFIAKGREDYAANITIKGLGLNEQMQRRIETLDKKMFALIRTFDLAQDEYYLMGDKLSPIILTGNGVDTQDGKEKTPVHTLTYSTSSTLFPPRITVPSSVF